MARDWAGAGVVWQDETVSKRDASGALVAHEGAQVPEITDLGKFATALEADGGDMLAVINASATPRSKSLTVKRDSLDLVGEALREACWRAILGVRGPRGAKPRVVMLPDGTQWTGAGRVSYVSEFMAACVDIGLDAGVARLAAEQAANNLGISE